MNDILYVIGNGFDLMHGMKSSYFDFYRWLIENNRIDYIAELQKVCPTHNDENFLLWSDFENALGLCNVEIVVNWSFEDLFLSGMIFSNYSSGCQELIDTQISEIVLNGFLKWVRSIDISSCRMIPLEVDSLFLTFNYTDTLEELYKIPSNQILHIHGRALTDDSIIVGHRNMIEYFDLLKETDDFRGNNNIINNICDYNDLYKPIECIIEHNIAFLRTYEASKTSLCLVIHVIV